MAVGTVIHRTPLLPEGLRKFERFEGDLAVLFAAPVARLKLRQDLSDPIAELGVPSRERVVVDLLKQTQVQKPVLLVLKHGHQRYRNRRRGSGGVWPTSTRKVGACDGDRFVNTIDIDAFVADIVDANIVEWTTSAIRAGGTVP